MSTEVRMNVRPDSTLHKVKVNMLTRVVTLIGDDGESVDIENNTANEFTRICKLINDSLTEEMIEYTY
tara:strand:+ start:8107 stop:8310 length:204 start_codon:yes stop_codon:yes gene_type:complete